MAVTEYMWNPLNDTVLQETDGAGNTQAVYHADPLPYGRLHSMRHDGRTFVYRYDACGNAAALTDDAGKTTDTYRYDAWGTQTARTGSTDNWYRFGGEVGYQYDDVIAEYSVRYRGYDPVRGRWQSKEPLGSVNGPNAYMYTTNSPIGHVDPSGLIGVRRLRQNFNATCGVPANYAYAFWDFSLSRPAPCEGWFVQKVTMFCKAETCETVRTFRGRRPRTVHEQKEEYWEAWHVPRRATLSDDRSPMDIPGSPLGTDTASRALRDDWKAVYVQMGEIRFYCQDAKMDPTGGGVGTGNLRTKRGWSVSRQAGGGQKLAGVGYVCGTSAGGLPRTLSEPGFWKNGQSIEKPVFRWFAVSYDCCCDQPSCNSVLVSAQP